MAFGRRKSDRLSKWDWDREIGKAVFEDRVCVDNNWENQQRNIENDKFRAVFDLENLQLGWIAFVKGVGVDAHLLHVGEDYGDRPSDKHQEGVRLLIKTDESLGGEVRELISTWRILWDALDALHTDFVAQASQHPGCLPNVDIVGTREQSSKSGTILVPVFKIAGWMPRPFELSVGGIPLVKRAKKGTDTADDSEFGVDTTKRANGGVKRPAVKDELADEIPF
jgi:hypothetical protein